VSCRRSVPRPFYGGTEPKRVIIASTCALPDDKPATARAHLCTLGVPVKSAALGLIFFFLLSCFAADSPDTREMTDPKAITSGAADSAFPIPIDDLFYTRSTGGGAWSRDGKQIVFFTNLTGRNNLWKVSADGGWPIQLSQSDDRQQFASWSRDGKWIAFQSDQGGGEIYDLYAIPGDGGAVVNLTNTPEISETSPVWSPDGKSLAIVYKPKTSSASDIALLDWSTHAVRNLTQEKTPDHIWSGPIWSPVGKTVYATRSNAASTDSDVFRVDVASGAQENLTKHDGEHRASANSISPDGRVLLITSDKPGGYPNVALLDVATRKLTWVTDLKWEASAGDFSPDGKQFTYEVNADGRNDIYLADMATLRATKLNIPTGLNSYAGNPTTFAPEGGRVLVSHQSSTQPGDLWVYDLGKREARQLSFSAIASLAAAKIPSSQLVHYRSFDGKIISAFVWVPFNLKRDGSNPAVVLPHGGPTGQTTDYFSRTVVALVTRGYVCIAPNVRGSTGYGIEFQKANYKDLGGGDLQDEVFAAKFLQATGYVDARKIGITGGSYGGYMTMMAIGKTPDVWAAGVEEYGIINWLTMMQHEDPFLQQYEKSLLGDPEKDRATYEANSPLAYIRNAKAPLLVLQGDNDIRVPKEEAEQVVKILQDAGKTVDSHYYANEGHGFAKRENQVDAIRRTIDWFDRYLKGTK
jgi:dipeptidyl aminopeptidase/acylaminoacyl peptidase